MKKILFTIFSLSLIVCGCNTYDEFEDTTGTGNNMYLSWKYATGCIMDDAAMVFACNGWIEADKNDNELLKEAIENRYFNSAYITNAGNGVYELYKYGNLIYRIETRNQLLSDSNANWSIRRGNYEYIMYYSDLVFPTFFSEGSQYVFNIKYAGVNSWNITVDSTAYDFNSAEWTITLPTGCNPTDLNGCSYEMTGHGKYVYTVYGTNDTRTTYTITTPIRQAPNSTFTPKQGKVSITASREGRDDLNVEAEILSSYSYKIAYRGATHVYED